MHSTDTIQKSCDDNNSMQSKEVDKSSLMNTSALGTSNNCECNHAELFFDHPGMSEKLKEDLFSLF